VEPADGGESLPQPEEGLGLPEGAVSLFVSSDTRRTGIRGPWETLSLVPSRVPVLLPLPPPPPFGLAKESMVEMELEMVASHRSKTRFRKMPRFAF